MRVGYLRYVRVSTDWFDIVVYNGGYLPVRVLGSMRYAGMSEYIGDCPITIKVYDWQAAAQPGR